MKHLSLSLRARFAVLIAITLVPVVGLTLYINWRGKQVLAVRTEQYVLHVLAEAADDQGKVINSTRQLLAALAGRVGDDWDEPGCRKMLLKVLDEHPVYSDIGVAGADGELQCSAISTTPANYSRERWFYHAGRVGFALDVWQGNKNPAPGLNLSYAVWNEETGRLQAVLFAILDIERLLQYGEIDLPHGAEYLLVSRDGKVLSALPNPQKWIGKTAEELPLVRMILESEEGVSRSPGLDGDTRLYAFKPLLTAVDTGLFVAVGLPVSIFDDAKRLLALHFLILIPLLLAAGILWFLTDQFIMRRINALAGAAQKLSGGDMKSRTGLSYGSSEIDELARIFDGMAETLEQHTNQLYADQQQLRSLTSQLLLVEERERRRIAAEMHDRIGQTLAMSRIKLGALLKSDAGRPAATEIAEVRQLVEQAIRDTRSIIYKISSPILYELGLEAAMEWLAEKVQQEHGILCTFVDDGREKPLDEDIRILLFQAASELLVNVVKHAGASRAWIRTSTDGQFILMEIEDNGTGFEISETGLQPRSEGYGLFSIKERLIYVKGSFEIHSSPGAGTRVTMKAPLKS
jgi:signal transduction histidine kinase